MIFVNPKQQPREDCITSINDAITIAAVFRSVELRQG
jgi:hypothetical protein